MSAHFARNIVAGTEPILACSGLLFCCTAQMTANVRRIEEKNG
jgi:hypothetical protein